MGLFKIVFKNRDEFEAALRLNSYADIIHHEDMIMVYGNEYFRDRFYGFLILNGIIQIDIIGWTGTILND